MTKACATVVVPNSSITIVTAHSAMLFRIGLAAERLAVFRIFVLAGIGYLSIMNLVPLNLRQRTAMR